MMLSACSEKTYDVGTKIKLWGGYDQAPVWLNGLEFYTGVVEGVIPSKNDVNARVVRLDNPITVEGVTGDVVVLELRYVGATWSGEQVVHIELCDFEPEAKMWSQQRQGAWVESHASVVPIK